MNDYEALRAATEREELKLNALGLDLFRMPDLSMWTSFMANLSARDIDRGGTGEFEKSDSFNPKANEALPSSRTFSIAVASPHEGYIAGIAVRAYVGEIKDVVQSGGLWVAYANLTRSEFEIADWPKGNDWDLQGPCAQRGGLYVDEDFQGRGIATALETIALYDIFLNPDMLDVRHAVGIRRHGDKRTGISKRRTYLGVAKIGMKVPKKLDLVHSSRDDVIKRARSANASEKALHGVVSLKLNSGDDADNATVLPFTRNK